MKKLSEDIVASIQGNQYVKNIFPDKGLILYTESFYVELYNYMKYGGMTPLEAYNHLGFSVEKLGEDRAYAAAKRAKSKAAFNPENINKRKAVNGTITRAEAGDLDYEEELDYMYSRNIYLEAVVSLVKKNNKK